LDTNPNAILVGFQNRLDPFQKGFHLIMKIADDFLTAHPDAQMALPGPGDDIPGVKEWAEQMTKKFPGRFWMPFGRYAGDVDDRLHAAGDFFLNPSLYEPYGISHLKSMKMMRPVIGAAVDGLRWSLSDEQPLFQNMTGGPGDNYKNYGAFGMLFQWNDMPTYRGLLGKVLGLNEAEQKALQLGTLKYSMADREQALTDREKFILKDNSERLRDCLERAYQTYKNPQAMATMALNGYKYVTLEHDPHKILSKYYFPSFLNLLSDKPKDQRPSLNQLRAEFERFRVAA
jgi:glycogen synthase